MNMRVIVGMAQGADPAALADRLRGLGASHVEPNPALGDVLLATVATAEGASFATRAATLAGVRYAEPDQPRFTT